MSEELVLRVELIDIAIEFAEPLLNDLPRDTPAFELLHRQTGGQRKILHAEWARVPRIGSKLKRSELAAEVSRSAREAILVRHGDISRHVLARPEVLRDDGSHLRIVDDRRRQVTGEEVIRRQSMIGDTALARSDDRELVGDLSHAAEVLAEDFARLGLRDVERSTILGRRFRLRIERLLRGKAAA